jgi:hypothetical protein
VPALSADKIGQEKGDDTRADFVTVASSGVSTRSLNYICKGSYIRTIWKD